MTRFLLLPLNLKLTCFLAVFIEIHHVLASHFQFGHDCETAKQQA